MLTITPANQNNKTAFKASLKIENLHNTLPFSNKELRTVEDVFERSTVYKKRGFTELPYQQMILT